MLHNEYEAVIGLEVHCQLLTNSKAFSPESAAFGAEANINVDPVSLGHPGTLPVLSDAVLDHAIRVGLATNCKITPHSIFARKQYFYPDLPKGYQISQYDTPICYGGHVDVEVEGESGERRVRRIGLTRIHIEEDAGKSVHDQDPVATLLDFNRSGVALIEIVSEPDIRSPREAALFLQKIRQTVRYLEACDGNMEEGSLRCDANVSIRKVGETALGTKTEVKNMNSFRHVERALEFEIERQIRLVEAGGEVVQETRLWDANKVETRSMRTKEEEHDYRYFPDPDLVPVVVDEDRIAELRQSLPEMPETRRRRYIDEFKLPEYDAGVLTEERRVAELFEETVSALSDQGSETADKEEIKAVSNLVMTDVLRTLKERDLDAADFPIEPERLAALIRMRLNGDISSTGAQQLFEAMLDRPNGAQDLARELNLLQVSDDSALLPIVEAVVAANQPQVAQYRSGKTSIIGFFIGQVMRSFDGSPDPQRVRELLVQYLDGGA